MTKIAINTTYGGFSLTPKAIKELRKLGVNTTRFGEHVERDDPRLIQVIEMLGKEASEDGDVEIVEIPNDVTDWYIEEYDGIEWIGEGRRWNNSGEIKNARR